MSRTRKQTWFLHYSTLKLHRQIIKNIILISMQIPSQIVVFVWFVVVFVAWWTRWLSSRPHLKKSEINLAEFRINFTTHIKVFWKYITCFRVLPYQSDYFPKIEKNRTVTLGGKSGYSEDTAASVCSLHCKNRKYCENGLPFSSNCAQQVCKLCGN